MFRVARYAVSTRAGMPSSSISPAGVMPGQVRVTFTGSSMQCPSVSPGKPCQSAPGASVQQDGSVRNSSGGASSKGSSAPVAGSVTV